MSRITIQQKRAINRCEADMTKGDNIISSKSINRKLSSRFFEISTEIQ